MKVRFGMLLILFLIRLDSERLTTMKIGCLSGTPASDKVLSRPASRLRSGASGSRHLGRWNDLGPAKAENEFWVAVAALAFGDHKGWFG